MEINLKIGNESYSANLNKPLDISIPLNPDHENPNCFYAPPPTSNPVIAGDFIGSIDKGGLLNFKNIHINPHGNGTHTECHAHIHKTDDTINQVLKKYNFIASLISLYPEKMPNNDRVISMNSLELLDEELPEALIIRTLPNDDSKLQRNYSGMNPPYVEDKFLTEIRRRGVKHLLIDLPSVDKEQDDGKLAGHKAFWDEEDSLARFNTISELIYVPQLIKDGLYLLQLMISPLELDASPSKPIIYELKKL